MKKNYLILSELYTSTYYFLEMQKIIKSRKDAIELAREYFKISKQIRFQLVEIKCSIMK